MVICEEGCHVGPLVGLCRRTTVHVLDFGATMLSCEDNYSLFQKKFWLTSEH